MVSDLRSCTIRIWLDPRQLSCLHLPLHGRPGQGVQPVGNDCAASCVAVGSVAVGIQIQSLEVSDATFAGGGDEQLPSAGRQRRFCSGTAEQPPRPEVRPAVRAGRGIGGLAGRRARGAPRDHHPKPLHNTRQQLNSWLACAAESRNCAQVVSRVHCVCLTSPWAPRAG